MNVVPNSRANKNSAFGLQQVKRETSKIANNSARVKSLFDIDVFLRNDAQRKQVESFIIQGFRKTYGASVSITMPSLLAIKEGAFKAALGVRGSSSPLFIEQYLDNQRIEDALATEGITVERRRIAEIGHLYSNTPKFALPLLLTAGTSLFLNHIQYLVFSATSKVRRMISRTGISIIDIATADPAKLKQSADSWGTYYETQPNVVAISTIDIINVINNTPSYLRMFDELFERIELTSKNIIGNAG